MKRYLFLITLLTALTGRIIAQSVTVDATIDSLQILIGEQAKIKLQVSLDTDKRAILPAYTDTLVRGVEIVDIAKPDTQMLNDGRRSLITQEYTVDQGTDKAAEPECVKVIHAHTSICSMTTPWAIPGILSPSLKLTLERSAPVGTKRIRFHSPDTIFGRI